MHRKNRTTKGRFKKGHGRIAKSRKHRARGHHR